MGKSSISAEIASLGLQDIQQKVRNDLRTFVFKPGQNKISYGRFCNASDRQLEELATAAAHKFGPSWFADRHFSTKSMKNREHAIKVCNTVEDILIHMRANAALGRSTRQKKRAMSQMSGSPHRRSGLRNSAAANEKIKMVNTEEIEHEGETDSEQQNEEYDPGEVDHEEGQISGEEDNDNIDYEIDYMPLRRRTRLWDAEHAKSAERRRTSLSVRTCISPSLSTTHRSKRAKTMPTEISRPRQESEPDGDEGDGDGDETYSMDSTPLQELMAEMPVPQHVLDTDLTKPSEPRNAAMKDPRNVQPQLTDEVPCAFVTPQSATHTSRRISVTDQARLSTNHPQTPTSLLESEPSTYDPGTEDYGPLLDRLYDDQAVLRDWYVEIAYKQNWARGREDIKVENRRRALRNVISLVKVIEDQKHSSRPGV